MNKVYIFGFSGHGKVVADIAISCGYEIMGYIDDNNSDAKTFQLFLNEYGTKIKVAIGIGDNFSRRKVFNRLKAEGIEIVSLVHNKAIIGSNVQIGEGVVVMPGVIINANSKISDGAIINSGAIVEHDNKIGAFSHISPNVALAGNVHVEELSWIGIGTSVIQGITIGKEVVVGAGSVVINNIENGLILAGVPAKQIESKSSE